MDINATLSTPVVSATATTGNGGLKAIQSEDFMKLLIKQLQYQDPFKPMDNAEMLGQMAQIRNMEMSTTLTSSLKSLTEQQRYGGAAALLGKQVSGVVTSADGTETTLKGIVTGVRFTSNGDVILELDSGDSLPLRNLTNVTDVTPSTGTQGSATAASTTATTAKPLMPSEAACVTCALKG